MLSNLAPHGITWYKILQYVSILFGFITLFNSCVSMKNVKPSTIGKNSNGYFYKVNDGTKLFIYDYQPFEHYNATIFIISGITGINHAAEKDMFAGNLF